MDLATAVIGFLSTVAAIVWWILKRRKDKSPIDEAFESRAAHRLRSMRMWYDISNGSTEEIESEISMLNDRINALRDVMQRRKDR